MLIHEEGADAALPSPYVFDELRDAFDPAFGEPASLSVEESEPPPTCQLEGIPRPFRSVQDQHCRPIDRCRVGVRVTIQNDREFDVSYNSKMLHELVLQ